MLLALSDKVVFAPWSANAVGTFDVATNSFETVSTGTVTMDWKFSGAATVGSKVVFAPYNANAVGIVDLATRKFTTVSAGSVTGSDKFSGAAALSF